MIEKLLKELVVSKNTDLIVKESNSLYEKYKTSQELKKAFVDAGRFVIDFEPNVENLFNDMAVVLSEDNMKKIAQDMATVSGYSFKERLLYLLTSLMEKYEIPRDQAFLYANRILSMILSQLPEIDPEKYDRLYQEEWRGEQREAVQEIIKTINEVSEKVSAFAKEKIEIYSADQLDAQLKKTMNFPSLGINFFEIDDENFKECFREKNRDEIVCVRARCREEAVYCILNEFWQLGEKRAIYVVKSKADWDRLTEFQIKSSILIPWFYANEIAPIEENTNIFIYTDGLPSFSNDEIQLRPRTFHTLTEALRKVGVEINEANRLVNETHGFFVPMKKRLSKAQFFTVPKWMETVPGNVKITALLLGQWTDAEGDKEIVSILSGMEYDKFMDNILASERGEEPFICSVKIHGKVTYSLVSVENSWEYLDIPTGDAIWDIFKELFIDVLNEDEKMFTYSAKDRLIAQFKGEKLFWSSAIRRGMIRSLIMKAYYKGDIAFQNSLDVLVNRLLSYIDNVEKWKYLSHYFRDICEVSPKAVLDRLFIEFEKPTGLLELFKTQDPDFLMGKNYYIDILFGVDEFLVQEEYARQGFEWLLKLDNEGFDYVSNSPKDSIGKVLCTWYNFSAFNSVNKKIDAAELALKTDKNAWEYLLEALPSAHRSVVGELVKPRYRRSVDNEDLLLIDVYKTTGKYVELLVNDAQFDPKRWCKLLDIADELSDASFKLIMDSVQLEALQMTEYEKLIIKKAVRKTIYKHRYYRTASWAMPETKIKVYEQLLKSITNQTPEYDYEYLFSSDRDIILLNPEPYDKDGKHDSNKELINNIIRNQIDDFKARNLDLSVLAEVCAKDPNSRLGTYLAMYYCDTKFDQSVFKILYNSQDTKALVTSYCNVVISNNENAFEDIIALKDELRFEEGFLVKLYGIQAEYTKDIPKINSESERMKSLFWKSEDVFIQGNYEWALDECKRYGTVDKYLKLLYRAKDQLNLTSSQLYDYLADIQKMKLPEGNISFEFVLKELLKPVQFAYIDDAERARKIVEIEVFFSHILDWEEMICVKREMEKSPEIYAEIVALIFKKDDEVGEKNFTEDERNRARFFHNFFDKAHFCPAEENGKVESDKLDKWIVQFESLLNNNGQKRLLGFLLGRLWVYSPAGRDFLYPCEAVREAIEKYSDKRMLSEYQAALFNKRGIYSPSAGKEEKSISERYKQTADSFVFKYPKTAEVFYSLSRRYLADAEEERKMAEYGNY